MIAISINDLSAKLPRMAMEAAANLDRQPEDPHPLEVALENALGEIKACVDPERLNDFTLRWAWLTIGAKNVHVRLNGEPGYLKDEYDRVMLTLRGIAKGDYPNLYKELNADPSAQFSGQGSVAYGSAVPRNFSMVTSP